MFKSFVKAADEFCRKHERLGYFIIAITTVLWVWFLNYFGKLGPELKELTDQGSFGDTFGSVNALFAGLAFAGIAYSIIIQSDQLKVSRKEMNAAQTTLRRTEASLVAQNAATYKQSFEATFFQMVNAFRVDVTAMKYGTMKDDRNRFDQYVKSIKETYESESRIAYVSKIEKRLESHYTVDRIHIELGRNDALKIFRFAYSKFHKQHGAATGVYFRTLYMIMRYIDTATFDANETKNELQKDFYFKFVRAQISRDEADLLMLNGLSSTTSDRFNDYLVRHRMLKNVSEPTNETRFLLQFIHPLAFGKHKQREFVHSVGQKDFAGMSFVLDILTPPF